MVTAITEGIQVSVETVYQPEYSNPGNEHFMFAYRVEISNLADYSIQLLRRQWFIFDSNNSIREVEGEGVVGLQPTLKPGQSHSYVSGCNLKSDIGSMRGNFTMKNLIQETTFKVEIPEFQLIAPYKLN